MTFPIKPRLVIGVGERGNWRHATRKTIKSYEEQWSMNAVEAMMWAGAFQNGFGRLDQFSIGDLLDYAVNLLPPQRTSGGFDESLARIYSKDLLQYAADQSAWLVLFGRRVSDTIHGRKRVGFCEMGMFNAYRSDNNTPWGVFTLVLPHPSARNRYLNSESNLRKVRESISRFRDLVEEGIPDGSTNFVE